MALNRYIAVVPVLGMDLHLLKFDGGYSWFRLWDDLQELDGRIVNQQIKLIVPLENVSKRPSKCYICTLVDATTEKVAYEKGLCRIEEFVFLANIYLRRSFRPLVHEAVTLPMPKTKSLNDISLIIENGNISKIISSLENWTLKVPYFGKITHKDYYPAHFELTDIQSNVSETANLISKKGWLAFEKKLKKLASLKSEQKELLVIIGQLYASANSAETIALSYIMLWEVLEAYSGTDKGRQALLSNETLGKIRKLVVQQGYNKDDTKTVLSMLKSLKKETLTQQMASIIQTQLFPDKNQNDVYRQLKDIRNTRNRLTHPNASKKTDKTKILNHYQQLREIVDKLLIFLRKETY